ncbi:MAG: polysaccharide deacetylase family protein [Oscillospiraceae bacterium]|nr:polysaccharide deacetylase family protein [Oscillospiraceae bacterium]
MASKRRSKIIYTICIVAIIIALSAVSTVLFNPFGIERGAVASPDDLTGRLRNAAPIAPAIVDSVRVPILMYHHFADDNLGFPGMVASGAQFAEHLRALRDAGFTTISFNELIAFVYDDAPLPERPVIITFDDGYLSNYEIAFPLLQRYNSIATVFIIGVTHARMYYKDTEHVLRWPRFDDEMAVRMIESGLVFIESHSYDMHQFEPWELPELYRRGILQRQNETDAEYIKAFMTDFELSAQQIKALQGSRPVVFSYPFGISTEQSDTLLRTMGVKVTLKITQGENIITRGDPDSLMSLHRFNVPWGTTPAELLNMIES